MLTLEQRNGLVAQLRAILPGWHTQFPVEVHVRRREDNGYLPDYMSSLFTDAGWLVSIRQSILAGERLGIVVYGTRPNSLVVAERIADLLYNAGFPTQRDRFNEMTDAFIIVALGT